MPAPRPFRKLEPRPSQRERETEGPHSHAVGAAAKQQGMAMMRQKRYVRKLDLMALRTLVYWHGIVGIPGKGPNWSEPYQPHRTIGELIQTMISNQCGERNRRIEILKFPPGHIDRVNPQDPYWSHNVSLTDYVQAMGGPCGPDVMLIYVTV